MATSVLSNLRPLLLISISAASVIIMLFINMIQILTLPVHFYSRPLYLKLQRPMASFIWALMQFSFEFANGADVTCSGDKLGYNESAMVISNHLGYSDFFLVHYLSKRSGMLGCGKYFAKVSLRYIPLFGWGMWMLGCVFLQRDWLADKKKIIERLSSLANGRVPIWFVSYPEGSRFTKEKCRKSNEFSIKNDLPTFDNVLLPRSKGFLATVKAFRDSHVQYLYDVTIAYYNPKKGFGFPPNVIALHFVGIEQGSKFFVNVRKYKLSDLPADDESQIKWLLERFKEKDQIINKWKLSIVDSNKKSQ